MRAAECRAFVILFALSVFCLLPFDARAELRPRPFALQDMRLGTSLSDFRQLRFLDVRQKSHVSLICAGDADASGISELHPFFDSTLPDSVLCSLFERSKEGRAPAPLVLDIFGERMRLLLTFSHSETEREPRLSQILVRCNNDHFSQVITLMRRAYGPPTNYEMSQVNTVYGDLPNVIYYWSNGVSTIEAKLMTLDLEDMTIVFSYTSSNAR